MPYLFVIDADIVSQTSNHTKEAWRRLRTDVNDIAFREGREGRGVAFLHLTTEQHQQLIEHGDIMPTTPNKNQRIQQLQAEISQNQREIERLMGVNTKLLEKLQEHDIPVEDELQYTAPEPEQTDVAYNTEDDLDRASSIDVKPVQALLDELNKIGDNELKQLIKDGYFDMENRKSILSYLNDRT